MIRMHASSKSVVLNGSIHYLPMITARVDKGRMIGSRVPQGAAREFQTFTTSEAAKAAAYEACQRAAATYPALLSVA